MRDSYIFHAHNPHGMKTSSVVLGIDAARTLVSGSDVHLDLALVFLCFLVHSTKHLL